MNKQKSFESMWIDIDVRMPPDDDTKILYYNPEFDRIGETYGHIFNTWIHQMRNVPGMEEKIRMNPHMNFLDGYFATHWMRRYRPQEEM